MFLRVELKNIEAKRRKLKCPQFHYLEIAFWEILFFFLIRFHILPTVL